MRRGSRIARVAVAAALVALVLAVAAAPARAAEAKVLGFACARNAKDGIAKIAKLVDKFVPGMGTMMVAGSAEQFFTMGGMAGIDWSKPVAAAILSGKAFGKTEPVGVLVGTLGDKDALAKLAEMPDGPKFHELRGDVVVASDTKDALAAITDKHVAVLSKYPAVAGDADLYMTFYVSRAIEEYKAEIDAALAEVGNQPGGAVPGGMPIPAVDPMQLVKAAGPLVGFAAKEVRRVSLMFQFNEEAIDIHGRLSAMKGGALEQFLDGQPQETTDLVKFLPADCVASAAVKGDLEKLRPLLDAAFAAVGPGLGAQAAEMRKNVETSLFSTGMTGEYAAGMGGSAVRKGLEVAEVAVITDPAKFRQAFKDGMARSLNEEALAGLGALGLKLAPTYKANAREHAGVQIDALTLASQADEPGAALPPITAVFELATVDKYGLFTVALAQNPAVMNELIDRVKGAGTPGLDTSPVFKKVLGTVDPKAHAVFHLSLNSFLAKLGEQAAKIVPMIGPFVPMVATLDANEIPIVAQTRTAKLRAGSAAIATVTLPHKPFVDLTQRVMKLIETFKGMGGPGKGPGPAPKPGPEF